YIDMWLAANHALLHACWKLNPPVIPSTSRTSPAKYMLGTILLCIVSESTSERGMPPAVTNSSLKVVLPSTLHGYFFMFDMSCIAAFRERSAHLRSDEMLDD